jgi:hypothetical protein
VACGGSETEVDERRSGPLVDHEKWVVLQGSDDPFVSERPENPTCDAAYAKYEMFSNEPSFGVDTQNCDYISVGQPSLLPVVAGDKLQLRIWHFQLTAPEAAEAHIAVTLAGTSLLDKRYPIPSGSFLDRPEVQAAADADQGSPIVFHVHNHGDNSFSFIEMSIKELAR